MSQQSETMLRIKNCFIGVSVPIHLHCQLCYRNNSASGRLRPWITAHSSTVLSPHGNLTQYFPPGAAIGSAALLELGQRWGSVGVAQLQHCSQTPARLQEGNIYLFSSGRIQSRSRSVWWLFCCTVPQGYCSAGSKGGWVSSLSVSLRCPYPVHYWGNQTDGFFIQIHDMWWWTYCTAISRIKSCQCSKKGGSSSTDFEN